ncbi:ATP-binding protein [bacterium]|nr:ATP-binding protein [bacterium]
MEGDRPFRPPRLRIDVAAVPECIPYLVDLTKRFLTSVGLDERSEAVSHLRIALAELITNVVRHGYAGREPGPLVVELAVEEACFTARLIDGGPPFDATRAADLPEPESLAEGGYGLGIVQKVMDDVEWRYVPGVGNETTVRKRLPAGAVSPGERS